jgi:hypothetical protein
VERGWPNLGVDILRWRLETGARGLGYRDANAKLAFAIQDGSLVWEPRVRRREWRPGVRLRMAAKKGPKMVDLKCKTNLSQSYAVSQFDKPLAGRTTLLRGGFQREGIPLAPHSSHPRNEFDFANEIWVRSVNFRATARV